MYLLVGLGNPGRKYANTRHNIGFKVVDEVARLSGAKIDKKRCLSRVGTGRVGGKEITLAKPQTFMNRSGEAVSRFLSDRLSVISDRSADHPLSLKLQRASRLPITDHRLPITGCQLLVVHDDLDLSLGRLKFSFGAGAGGHNGVSSVIEKLGTKDFYRLRVGIGRPPPAKAPEDYVLDPFDLSERKVVGKALQRAVEAIEVFYKEGPEKAMQAVN